MSDVAKAGVSGKRVFRNTGVDACSPLARAIHTWLRSNTRTLSGSTLWQH